MTDIDLDLRPRTRGRARVEVDSEYIRDLTEADLPLLEVPRGITSPVLKRIRDSHHALARILADGTSETEAAAITGYCISRISILKQDPAFMNLVEENRRYKNMRSGDQAEQMGTITKDALGIIRDRLEDAPEDVSLPVLVDIVTKFCDRTGYGPATKSTNVNVSVNYAGRLEAARRRIGKGQTSPSHPFADQGPSLELTAVTVDQGAASSEDEGEQS